MRQHCYDNVRSSYVDVVSYDDKNDIRLRLHFQVKIVPSLLAIRIVAARLQSSAATVMTSIPRSSVFVPKSMKGSIVKRSCA